MSRGKQIEGFIYEFSMPWRGGTGARVVLDLEEQHFGKISVTSDMRKVSMTRAEWRGLMRKARDSGGFTRREAGETFIHDRTGRIVAEAYDLIPDPKEGS